MSALIIKADISRPEIYFNYYCFQTAFIPVPLCWEGGGLGSISFCIFGEGGGGMAEVRWAGTLLSKDHPLVGIHICPCPYQEETKMCSFQLHQQLDRWYCHGHTHVVKSCPRWSHTWHYAPSLCHTLPWIQYCTGRPNGECIAAVVNEHKLARYSVVL